MWEALKKVGGAMFEDEGPKPVDPQNPQAFKPPQQMPPAQGQPYVQPRPIGSANQDMVNAIRDVTFSRNTALTALIKAGDELKDFIPDPVMRLKAAYKTAGGGRKPQDIADAVAIHLNDVNTEEGRFATALDMKMRNEVQTLTDQANQAELAMQNKTDEIKRMTERIQQLQQELNDSSGTAHNLRAEAANKEAGFRRDAEEFKAAAEAVRVELNTHKAAILSTLT